MLQFLSLYFKKVKTMKKTLLKTALLIGFILSFQSHAIMITGGFTGAWYNADEPGQGLLVQILDGEEGTQALVVWFTFDPEGGQNWLMGVGPVDGDSLTVDLSVFTGGILNTEGFDSSNIVTDIWGTISLQFQNCNKGVAAYEAVDEDVGAGEYTIKRLTKTKGTDCSGGTSDDSSDAPDEDVQIDFVNSGVEVDASGRLKFERNDNFDQLKIWYKDLPEGSYDLLVDGEIVATLEAKANGTSHQFFSSPQHEDWLLLDFEVLSKTVEIAQDGVVYLTVDVPDQSTEDVNDDDD